MKYEETKYCEECQNCKLIEYNNGYCIYCSKRPLLRFFEPVIYCKYKKLKKEKKKK